MSDRNLYGSLHNQPGWTPVLDYSVPWSGGGASPFTTPAFLADDELEVDGPASVEIRAELFDNVTTALQAAPVPYWRCEYTSGTILQVRELGGFGRQILPGGYRYKLRPGWYASSDPNGLAASSTPHTRLRYLIQRSFGAVDLPPEMSVFSSDGNVQDSRTEGARVVRVTLPDTTTPVLELLRGQLTVASYASGVLRPGDVLGCRLATWLRLRSRAGTTSVCELLY